MNINLLAIEWSIFVKIALLILAGIIFVLVLILFIYELFFKKNFVYKVTYYTTDDPEYAIRTTTAPNTSIVTVGKNEEGFVISKIILTKSKKKADLSDPMVSAQMDSYNIKDIVYKSSQAKIVGEYETKESDTKFTSIIVTKKK